ncbi:MAG TPA: enoyl-CoA hydratase/isomerase family protein [Acidimicrobiales bacterium]|nr:enoyl-CoA hydratase/isomerase family protein [Acidimicrobiales bacterium]
MIHLEVRDRVATVLLDRPPVNAWDVEQLDRFEQALDTLRRDERIAVAVVRGAGRHFSAGADIAMMTATLEGGDPGPLNAFAARFQGLFLEWEELEIPTVAVLHGAATGGGLELALACDLRIASEDARLALPEVRLGLLPAGGGTQRLTRLIGRGRAMRLMLTGELVDGREAERLGIVEWCAPAAQLDERVAQVLGALLAGAGPAQPAIKRCVSRAGSAEGYASESRGQRVLHATAEAESRLREFVDARRGR